MKERKDMNDMICVTCNHSLQETGRMTLDKKQAICTVCKTTYLIFPATDTFGNPLTDAEGRNSYHLEPILPINPSERYMNPSPASVCSSEINEDYATVKRAIDRCKSVNDFLKFLNH